MSERQTRPQSTAQRFAYRRVQRRNHCDTSLAPQHCIRNHCDRQHNARPRLRARSTAADEMTGAIYVSRHGVRSPYPPGGTGWPAHGQSWEAWTSAPGARPEFGMTDHAFKTQELTAHGKTLVKPLGASAREAWAAAGLEIDCDRVKTYADDSTRDVQTAKLWLEGLGCADNPVDVANSSLPEMVPILSDDFVQPNGICKVATEGQARGDLEAMWMR